MLGWVFSALNAGASSYDAGASSYERCVATEGIALDYNDRAVLVSKAYAESWI